MECINKVILAGNLGADPEIRVLETGVKMARFSLATSEYYIDNTGAKRVHTQWHSVVCWRSVAQFVDMNCRVGTFLRIEGRLRTRQIDENQPQAKQSPYEIIATSAQLMTNDALPNSAPSNASFAQEHSVCNSQNDAQSEIPKAPLDLDKLPF